jgi:membrane protease subunit (stomatin/prohibitin family)
LGVLDFIKSQFIEVIEWTDDTTDIMVYRFPVQNKEIKMGAQLIVRESQSAVFVNEGVITDVFGPGRYQLVTQNMPVLTKLKSWKYGFNSPFKAEVYFINTKQFTDQKWGTSNPIMMRDKEFGMLRLRAYGIFSFKVTDPVVFLKEVFGTNQQFDTESIANQLKHSVVMGVGGSFEVIAGLKREAPALLRYSGWEWAYRMLQDPRRVNRMPHLIKFWYQYLR